MMKTDDDDESIDCYNDDLNYNSDHGENEDNRDYFDGQS